jgi:predicted ATP-grasp superfamily ATP-dependent carboligase
VQDKNIRFSNFSYTKNKYYFIFISELKAYGVGHFFKEAISKALYIPIEDIEFITIAPDVFEQYNYENLIIMTKNKERENKRTPLDEFIYEISHSKYIDTLIDEILQNQDELYLYMFESNKFMTLNKKKNVILVGPSSDVVTLLSNKISLYEIFSSVVPMAKYYIAKSYNQLIKLSSNLFKTYDKIFISLEKSAAGANSIIASSINDIEKKFQSYKNGIFLITQFIEHVIDPTTLGVVINEKDVFVAGIADQRIEQTSFRGSTYPTRASKNAQKEIIRQTRIIGRKMAKLGYRGIFGCDFIVTKDDKVYFIETNPRKQGTTMEFCCALKTQLPKGSPNLPEIEFYAVTENAKAPRCKEPDFFKTNIYWSTYNEKISSRLLTYGYLPQQRGELEMFEAVAKNKLKKEYMILEHIGQDFFVNEGSFLGRVIATGQNYQDVEQGIQMGRKMIEFTIKELV